MKYPGVEWTEEDKTDWLLKAMRGDFGPDWKDFSDNLQMAINDVMIFGTSRVLIKEGYPPTVKYISPLEWELKRGGAP